MNSNVWNYRSSFYPLLTYTKGDQLKIHLKNNVSEHDRKIRIKCY